jgi:hypothetical protein
VDRRITSESRAVPAPPRLGFHPAAPASGHSGQKGREGPAPAGTTPRCSARRHPPGLGPVPDGGYRASPIVRTISDTRTAADPRAIIRIEAAGGTRPSRRQPRRFRRRAAPPKRGWRTGQPERRNTGGPVTIIGSAEENLHHWTFLWRAVRLEAGVGRSEWRTRIPDGVSAPRCLEWVAALGQRSDRSARLPGNRDHRLPLVFRPDRPAAHPTCGNRISALARPTQRSTPSRSRSDHDALTRRVQLSCRRQQRVTH